MYFFKINNIVFGLKMNGALFDAFINRIYFEDNKGLKEDVRIDFIEDNDVMFIDEYFVNTYEPKFDEKGFYREIHGVCTLRYYNGEKKIVVKYRSDVFKKEILEVIVDATLQFISLSMLYYNILPLHVAIVEIQNRGVLIVGNSGAGKTTLEYSLINKGYNFFSDDIAFLDDCIFIYNNTEKVLAIRNDTIKKLKLDIDGALEKKMLNKKTLLILKNEGGYKRKIMPDIILFPTVGKQYQGHNIIPITKAETIKRLIELTISSELPTQFKTAYFKRLCRLVEKAQAYEVSRSRACDKIETDKICEDITKIHANLLEKEYIW